MDSRRIIVVLPLVIFALGCASTSADDKLRARASFDLNCEASDLTVTTIDKMTRGVEGCGQRAAYVKHCSPCANGYPACDCTWLINGDGRRRKDDALRAGGSGQAEKATQVRSETAE